MNIANWLRVAALRAPEAPAIFAGGSLHADYGAFADRARRIGAGLARHQGVRPGDRVAIFLKNCPEFLELLFAIWWQGAVAVPINAKLHPKEVAFIVEDSGARLLVSDAGDIVDGAEIALGSEAWQRLLETEAQAQPPAEAARGDLAWLFYTSGTTGRPKGVMLSHGNLMAMSFCYALDIDAVSPERAVLYPAPMSHGAGLYALPYVRAGARHVVPPSRGFEADEIAELAQHHKEAVYFAAPTMIRRQVEHARATGYDGTGIRTVIYGGGPMYARDIDAALAQFGPRFAQIYGQGESPMTITGMSRAMVADDTHPNWRARRDSVGIAQASIELRIVDEALRDLPPREAGEILVRGDTVMLGYWGKPEATAETIVDGWLRTGDIGTLDPDGFLTLTDRAKDVIISGGTNIYPREVEEVLVRHPDVAEAAVIGVPDDEWGERVKACVVLREGGTSGEAELDAWCRSEMASFKKPSLYAFLPDLPKNAYGKVLKRDLREGVRGVPS